MFIHGTAYSSMKRKGNACIENMILNLMVWKERGRGGEGEGEGGEERGRGGEGEGEGEGEEYSCTPL